MSSCQHLRLNTCWVGGGGARGRGGGGGERIRGRGGGEVRYNDKVREVEAEEEQEEKEENEGMRKWGTRRCGGRKDEDEGERGRKRMKEGEVQVGWEVEGTT